MKHEKQEKRNDLLKSENNGKTRNLSMKIVGVIFGTLVIGMITFFIISTENEPEVSGEVNNHEQYEGKITKEDLLDKALYKMNFNSAFPNVYLHHNVLNDNLAVTPPSRWSVTETEDEKAFHIELTGDDGGKMDLLLFKTPLNEELFDARQQEWITHFAPTEEVTITADELV
mgnify:CR=1 FL=1